MGGDFTASFLPEVRDAAGAAAPVLGINALRDFTIQGPGLFVGGHLLGKVGAAVRAEALKPLGRLAGVKIFRAPARVKALRRLLPIRALSAHAAGETHAIAVAAPPLEHIVHIKLVGGIQLQLRDGEGDGLTGLLKLGAPQAGRVAAKDSSI